MDIYATFLRAVRRHRLIEPGDRVLAAVSGGADSVALLHLLRMLQERMARGDEPAASDEPAAGTEPAAGNEPVSGGEPAAGGVPTAGGEPVAGDEPAADDEPAPGDEPAAGGEGAFELEVIHLEHGVRGQAGRDDMAFVLDLAGQMGLEAHIERRRVDAGDGGERAGDSGERAGAGGKRAGAGRLPSEDALRRARHRFYIREAEQREASVVAVGSTRDDQAETVLLNLARGAGGRGLGGMEPIRPLEEDDPTVALVRPLLDLPRAELRKWLKENGFEWREDETNRDPRYLRNRVRRELMPVLEELRPGAGSALARAADLLREDEALLDALARAELEGMRLGPEGGRLAYDAGRLAELPTALGRRLVRLAAVEALAGALDDIQGTPGAGPALEVPWAPGSRQVEAVLDLARERRGGQVDLGDRCIARVKSGELTFQRS